MDKGRMVGWFLVLFCTVAISVLAFRAVLTMDTSAASFYGVVAALFGWFSGLMMVSSEREG